MSVDIYAENAGVGHELHTFGEINTTGFGDINAQGFARSISYNVGEIAQFCVDGNSTVIDIYRVGWYGGEGFRVVDSITNTPTTQPEAEVIPESNGATTCTGWSVTATWAIPADATSGIYMAAVRSVPPFAPNAFYIVFVVRDDEAEADIIYKTSDTTWGAAYNHYGLKTNIDGRNVYGLGQGVGNIQERSYAASYHRPVITRRDVAQTYFWACELPLIRWLERMGYTMKYVTGVDLDKHSTPAGDGGAAYLGKGKVFLSSGHDEYWTEKMRLVVEAYRASGGHSIFMSGNEVFWKARYEYVDDEAIMWCYKDTMPGPSGGPDNAPSHVAGAPLDPVAWTGTWKDTRWEDNRPEWFLTGTDFRMNGVNDHNATIVQNPYSGLKVWGGSSLNDGDIQLSKVVGFEADSMRPEQPSESVRVLAAYLRNINGSYADDNGEHYNGNGDLNWGIVSQRYSSGAVTIGFGTCQWSWALDGTHDRGDGEASVNLDAQQFTANILQGLGAVAHSPHPGIEVLTEPFIPTLSDYGLIPGSTGPEEPSIYPFWRRGDGTLLDWFSGLGDHLTTN